jgi:hypothetical protein
MAYVSSCTFFFGVRRRGHGSSRKEVIKVKSVDGVYGSGPA